MTMYVTGILQLFIVKFFNIFCYIKLLTAVFFFRQQAVKRFWHVTFVVSIAVKFVVCQLHEKELIRVQSIVNTNST